jgi:hypothetical protein
VEQRVQDLETTLELLVKILFFQLSHHMVVAVVDAVAVKLQQQV